VSARDGGEREREMDGIDKKEQKLGPGRTRQGRGRWSLDGV